MEEWKEIPGYDDYEISNLGRVKSLKRNILLKPSYRGKNYPAVKMCHNGIVETKSIHRLVAEAFLPNPNNYPCVNHKDENKSNNCVDNLEWCTAAYNNSYGSRRRIIKKNKKPIMQYTLEGEELCYWFSISGAGEETGINRNNIASCCKGCLKTAGGFIWKYA